MALGCGDSDAPGAEPVPTPAQQIDHLKADANQYYWMQVTEASGRETFLAREFQPGDGWVRIVEGDVLSIRDYVPYPFKSMFISLGRLNTDAAIVGPGSQSFGGELEDEASVPGASVSMGPEVSTYVSWGSGGTVEFKVVEWATESGGRIHVELSGTVVALDGALSTSADLTGELWIELP